MKPYAFLFLISMGLASCSKTCYYAFTGGDDYAYCTIEYNPKKKTTIYRGYATDYSFSRIGYLYIKSKDNVSRKKELVITRPMEIYYTTDGLDVDHFDYLPDCQTPLKDTPQGAFISYAEEYRKDTLDLMPHNNTPFFETEPCYKRLGLRWMPPYMVPVKKIDYSRFPKQVQHLHLKDPARH
ncbi:hypothetical protein [Chitinophaga qingshengii]|uniref:Lipoprotein n=1 Tax=Chitinophaga qingshengii TaxID=1569794 RepID=A0ABR7TZ11_9BACT|nr:hypothetical protein [Chitinophaga qingshengii]MBC9934829.1 hypothetical protein [Chitinophaga qingshengii]